VKRTLDAFTQQHFDLLILGGGITGAGVALDAALNGWRVGLIDKGDFASGTSSASSKLIHGGLRYLEHGDLRLVYQALHERQRLLRNAPHLVRPLRFIIPFYQGARLGRWSWRAGLTLYDLLAGAGNLRRSRPLTVRHLRHEFPGLRGRGLMGGTAYYDAQMDDARLCIEVLESASRVGAQIANYVEAVGFDQQDGRITGVRVVDRVGSSAFTIRARQVLNATGPWVDATCRLAGDSSGPHLQPTKGIHLVAAGRGLGSAFLLLHPHDGRVFFVIPWPAAGGKTAKMLVGTTDTLADESLDGLTVGSAEIDYLRAGFDHYFQPPLETTDILGTFAGVRPLIRSRPGDPSALSREFRVFEGPGGLLSVAGGKYTTYRYMAEVVAAKVARCLHRPHRCRTREHPLIGAPAIPWHEFECGAAATLVDQHGLAPEAAQHLIRRYGRRAPEIAAYLDTDRRLAEPVTPGEPDIGAEFLYQRQHEMAIQPADFLLRRTHLGLFHPELLGSPPAAVCNQGWRTDATS
jgi:glycerol-3-phosphate dehydrogenase